MSSSEIEENVNKIKELLKSEDFGVVNTGLELVRSLDEEAVYEKLLEGCSVNEEGKLVNEKKEISDYLVCSLASISNGQKAKEILDNVTNLDLSSDESINNVDGLANLTNIDKLDLSGCKSLTNVDGLANLTNLIELNLSSYFYGFAFMDYSNERKKLSIKESILFIRKNKGFASGVGSLFSLCFFIPVIGGVMASFLAIICVVNATIGVEEIYIRNKAKLI